MNILWLPSWYPSVHDPVDGCFIQKQAEAVCQYSPQTRVAVLYVLRAEVNELETHFVEKDNLLEIRLFYPKKAFFGGGEKVAYAWHYWKAHQKGMQILKQFDFKPDLIHLQVVYSAGLYALWLKKVKKLPMIISEHWSGYSDTCGDYERMNFLRKLYFKICFKNAHPIIIIKSEMKQQLEKHGLNGTFRLIPNVVKTDLFYPLKEHNAPATTRFIHVSSLKQVYKNGIGILNVVQKLAQKNKKFVLEIVGDGEDRPVLTKIVDTYALNHIVSFTGLASTEMVAAKMRQSDVFVLFSNYEGLPCVLLEALASGLPVIATETGNIDEWVTPETGILLEIGDENALLSAMEWMIDNHFNYDKNKIRQKIVEKASYQAVGKALTNIYESNCLK
jgi:glycosyltransferase involved in cell wall biosynthesis